MFNPFPDLLFLGPYFAPLLLRATLGIVLLFSAFNRLKKDETFKQKTIGVIELVAALALAAGFYVQIAAVAAFILALFATHDGRIWKTRLLLAAIALSLLISGAGAFAFDLPL